MSLGPINFIPYIDEYELRNDKNNDGKQKHIFDTQELIRRKEERAMINAYIQMPCRVSYIASRLGKSPYA